MPTVSPRLSDKTCRGPFVHAAVPAEEAQIVADSLVTSNLMGMDSHGVIRVMQYLDLIEKGDIKPDGRLEIVTDAPAMVVAKGNWGFGMVVARQADKPRHRARHPVRHRGRLRGRVQPRGTRRGVHRHDRGRTI